MLALLFFFCSSLSAEPLDLSIGRFEGSGPEGPFLLYVVRPHGSLLYADRPRAAAQALEAGVLENRTFVVVWEPYSPDLFDWKGEETLGRSLEDHLHNQCYVKDPAGAPYVDHSIEETECYGRRMLEVLRGQRFLFTLHTIWGDPLDRSEFFGWLRYVVLFVTLVLFSLPSLFLSLALIGAFWRFLRERPVLQRAVKVVLPLLVGISWLFAWILTAESGIWTGALVSFKLWVPLGGLFSGLGFLPVMWMADHLFFPENDPPRLWLVLVLYLIAPLLIAGAGAAGSRRAVSGPGRRTEAGSGGMTGGGGAFGGGGASASF